MTTLSLPWATAVLALAAPQISEDSFRRSADYPQWALLAEQSAFAYFELFVAPDGEVLRCDMLAFVGNERLAKSFCRVSTQRKPIPATDSDGKPAYGKLRLEMKMLLPGTKMGDEVEAFTANPEYQLVVKSLPPEDGEKKQIKLAIQVGGDGSVEACANQEGADSIYTRAACAALQNDRFAPETGKDGLPLSYVAEVTVDFVLD